MSQDGPVTEGAVRELTAAVRDVATGLARPRIVWVVTHKKMGYLAAKQMEKGAMGAAWTDHLRDALHLGSEVAAEAVLKWEGWVYAGAVIEERVLR